MPVSPVPSSRVSKYTGRQLSGSCNQGGPGPGNIVWKKPAAPKKNRHSLKRDKRDHAAGADLLSAIQMRVKPTLTALQPDNSRNCPRAPPLLNEAIAEYLALGVLQRMNQPETQSTKPWAPVFGRRKADSGNIRMITDLRLLNSAWAQPLKFKTDY